VRTRDEDRILFRDGSGRRFAIRDAFRGEQWDSWSTRTRQEYDDKHQRPISRAILRGGYAVVLLDGVHESLLTRHHRIRAGDYGSFVSRKDHIEGSKEELTGRIVVEKCMRVILVALYHVDEIIEDTLERLAHKIRGSEITRELTAIEDRESSQYKAKLEASEQVMRTAVGEAMDSNSQFREAIKLKLTPKEIGDAWPRISSWFLGSAYDGAMLNENQEVSMPF